MQDEPPILGDNVLVNEVQLILAEKRPAMSQLRTGITVLVLPLTVLSVLITTSRFYDVFHVLGLLIPLLLVAAGLVALGGYLIVHSIKRIRPYDRLIRQFKQKHIAIAEFIE